MQKNIEVEIRGRISKDKREELVNFLENFYEEKNSNY